MSKHFYIVVSLHSNVGKDSSGGGILSGITSLFKKTKPAPSAAPMAALQTYQAELEQQASLILGGLSGMGLKGKLLGQEDLMALFADLYNPVVQPTAPQPTS